MDAVINRLTFRDDVDPSVFAAAEAELPPLMRAIPGFEEMHVVQTGEREVTLIIVADSAATLDRVATEVGSPWMIANVVPLLAGPPERRVGPLLASSRFA